MLSEDGAVSQVKDMIQYRKAEKDRLDRINNYLRGEHDYLWLPSDIDAEVRRIADIARVPVCKLAVDSVVQSMYVDGYRARRAEDNDPVWDIWQANGMDRRQIGVHRSSSGYGAGYTTVLPGDTDPVIRGVSPRDMTTVYASDPDWPMWGLEKYPTAEGQLWRLFDETHTYWVGNESSSYSTDDLVFIESDVHGAEVTPIVRFPDTEDLDDETRGEVEPLIPIQDQIDMTTFGLLVAQHFGAHGQKYIIGLLLEQSDKIKMSASRVSTFDDDPDSIEIGEFSQTDLNGYLDSREASLRHLAIISQTPVNELVGMLVNIGAEALVAARDAHHRKLDERKIVRGECWEQALGLAGRYVGIEVDPAAWVRWRDTEARALGAAVDALGKAVTMLEVPAEAMWPRLADAMGVPQQELEEWRRMANAGDPLGRVAAALERQSN